MQPDDPVAGESLTFHAEISNQGEATAEDVTVRFLLDGQPHGPDQQVGRLAPDEERSLASEPWQATEGEHNVTILLDPSGQIQEEDEENNRETLEFDVEPGVSDDDEAGAGRERGESPGSSGERGPDSEDPPRQDGQDADKRDDDQDDGPGSENASGSERTPPPGNRAHRVGQLVFTLEGDQLRNVTYRGVLVLEQLTIPGLGDEPEIERSGSKIEIESEDASLEARGNPGLRLSAQSEGTITAALASGIRAERSGEYIQLRADGFLLTLEGDGVRFDGRTIHATEELELRASAQPKAQQAIWEPARGAQADGEDDDAAGPRLPVTFLGRYMSFELNTTGVENLTVHGVPLDPIRFRPAAPIELERSRTQLQVEGDTFELHAIDAPGAQLRIEAGNATTAMPPVQTLPSGARVMLTIEEDEVRLRIQPPSQQVLATQMGVEHLPAREPPRSTPGPRPGLETGEESSSFQVVSEEPGRVLTRFAGELNGTSGTVGLSLGLQSAMLIEDTDGDGKVGIGEPALATRPLGGGHTTIVEGQLVTRFQLWSGNLTLTVEPGDGTAKITYAVEDLRAPPGTLFVLETVARAPENATLRPTGDGVVVEHGRMRAVYSAAGPVTVDGEPAWARHAVLAHSDGTVSVLVAYPAGDEIEHDPTIAIQSAGAAVVAEVLAASPWAVLVGALAAGTLVALSVVARRRGPR